VDSEDDGNSFRREQEETIDDIIENNEVVDAFSNPSTTMGGINGRVQTNPIVKLRSKVYCAAADSHRSILELNPNLVTRRYINQAHTVVRARLVRNGSR
ncbi:unnamed protein product, partial [Choristocarpus tenellus]